MLASAIPSRDRRRRSQFHKFTQILYRFEANASEDATNLTNTHTKHIHTITTDFIILNTILNTNFTNLH